MKGLAVILIWAHYLEAFVSIAWWLLPVCFVGWWISMIETITTICWRIARRVKSRLRFYRKLVIPWVFPRFLFYLQWAECSGSRSFNVKSHNLRLFCIHAWRGFSKLTCMFGKDWLVYCHQWNWFFLLDQLLQFPSMRGLLRSTWFLVQASWRWSRRRMLHDWRLLRLESLTKFRIRDTRLEIKVFPGRGRCAFVTTSSTLRVRMPCDCFTFLTYISGRLLFVILLIAILLWLNLLHWDFSITGENIWFVKEWCMIFRTGALVARTRDEVLMKVKVISSLRALHIVG